MIELQDLEMTFPPGHFEVNSMGAHPSVKVQAAMAGRIGAWLQQHPDSWQIAGGSPRGGGAVPPLGK